LMNKSGCSGFAIKQAKCDGLGQRCGYKYGPGG